VAQLILHKDAVDVLDEILTPIGEH
jgi:hypothetical protein